MVALSVRPAEAVKLGKLPKEPKISPLFLKTPNQKCLAAVQELD